jgi:hypothetical protein
VAAGTCLPGPNKFTGELPEDTTTEDSLELAGLSRLTFETGTSEADAVGVSLGPFVEVLMFGFLTLSPGSRQPLVRRGTTLCLERLEDRLSPASAAGETITLNITYLPGGEATFSGHLQNQNGPIANQAILLTGAVQTSMSTDSQGNYSITQAVPQLGPEYAASIDGLSNIALLIPPVGSLTVSSFSAIYQGNGLWLFSGTVTGASTQGTVVSFSGITALQGQSTTVNADGTFEFFAAVDPNQIGTVYAQVVDSSGDTSLMVGAQMTLTP